LIKTKLDSEDFKNLIALGYQFHQESHFRDTDYNSEKVFSILRATQLYPDRFFVAFDTDYNGVILLQMSSQFFSNVKWAGDQAFYVKPEFRGSSLAHELLEAGATWAKKNDATELVILHNAGIGLESAKHYYRKEGFELSGMIFNKRLI